MNYSKTGWYEHQRSKIKKFRHQEFESAWESIPAGKKLTHGYITMAASPPHRAGKVVKFQE
jgi:hypothetical protein